MNKIEQIKNAILLADNFKSKLTKEALEVPGFTSLKIRHLFNNLGELATNYLEVGSHLGSHFVSTTFRNSNIKNAIAIDNYSEFNKEGETKEQFLKNAETFVSPETKWDLIEQDCFTVKDFPCLFDFFNYDALHSESAQQRAITYFKDYVTDEFILYVDDFGFPGVESGTRTGIKLANLEILFEQTMVTPENGLHNDHWHNNAFVALLKKKPNE